jgi:hypothetical protein
MIVSSPGSSDAVMAMIKVPPVPEVVELAACELGPVLELLEFFEPPDDAPHAPRAAAPRRVADPVMNVRRVMFVLLYGSNLEVSFQGRAERAWAVPEVWVKRVRSGRLRGSWNGLWFRVVRLVRVEGAGHPVRRLGGYERRPLLGAGRLGVGAAGAERTA